MEVEEVESKGVESEGVEVVEVESEGVESEGVESKGVEVVEVEKGSQDKHLVDFLQLRSRELREQQQVVQRVIQEAEEVKAFKHLLENWLGRYTAYWLVGSEDIAHTMEECPNQGGDKWNQVQYMRDQVKKEVFGKRRLERYSGCFYCGVPQALCSQWTANRNDGGWFTIVKGGVYQYKETIV